MANTARLDTVSADARTGRTLPDTALLIGRIALVAIFVTSGFSKLMGLEGTAGYIASKGLPAPMALAALSGLAEVALGALVAVGFKTRLSAVGLVAFTVIATAIFHDFWNMQGMDRMNNQIQAMKNLAMIGGLLILAGVGPGRFSVDRR